MEYRDESQVSDLTNEEFMAARGSARPFTLCILRPGPNFEPPGPDPTVGTTAIIFAHGKRNVALQKAGLMPVVCPVGDGSDVSGVSLLDVSLEDATRMMDADPGVKAGVFTYELHACRALM